MTAPKLDPELLRVFAFLRHHPHVRHRLAAPLNKTVVYSGGLDHGQGPQPAWRMLAQAKAKEPQRFDYVTVEERLRQFHVVEFGESLYEHANRVASDLKARSLGDQALILWRALSGIYIQGATGRVRALVLPGAAIANSVFSLSEVSVLLKPDVLRQIEIDATLLREFRAMVRLGSQPAPIVVM
jgi:hypothetical protein